MPSFANACDFQVNDSLFFDQSSNYTKVKKIELNQPGHDRLGLQKLLEHSIPGASHDSSDRYPPPLCHPGTREDHIGWLMDWTLGSNEHSDHIAWVKGPAGVGKSAIAQSCAESLSSSKRLGASFFFSRPNKRSDPKRFFTSIAYQLAVRFKTYGDFLNESIQHDPTLVKKSLPSQFHSLMVAPIDELKLQGKDISEKIIIVDGLDECDSADAQRDIVRIVAQSVRDNTTPFLWIFFSRLEPHIVSTFNSSRVIPLATHVELKISRDIDKQILKFLRDKLSEVGQEHGLVGWPSERDLLILVDLSSGLFAYAQTVVLFVQDDDSSGPEAQLNIVLRLAQHKVQSDGHKHPLSALDLLYTLILQRLSPKKLQVAQWIVLAIHLGSPSHLRGGWDSAAYANLLGLSEGQFRNVCQSLHSVMYIDPDLKIRFHHASFMDFLEDPTRSNEYSIWDSSCLLTLLDQLLNILTGIEVYDSSVNRQLILGTPASGTVSRESPFYQHYSNVVCIIFKLLGYAPLTNDAQRLQLLDSFDFRKVALTQSYLNSEELVRVNTNTQQVKLVRPQRWRNALKVLRTPFSGGRRKRYYTIGHHEYKALLKEDVNLGVVTIVPSPGYSITGFQEFFWKLGSQTSPDRED